MARSTDTTERSAVAKHRVLLELGQGGMSNVYLAVARGPADFHKLLVLKVLREDLAEDEAFRTMALSEAKIAARLNHPNVVQTYEVLNDDERPVIVMEYLEGQSLSNVVAKTGDGSFTLAMSLQVLVDALSGLHHVHELADYDGKPFGLVHRDFTPQNIFLGYDGHVKIIDFGIARTELAHGDETRAGTIKGKVRYMSPEQILGSPPVDRRADIFAAGMVLWELAAGESPWKGASDLTIINRVINNELPSMTVAAPGVAPDIQRICTKAIQFDRENRYATAAEMAADLEQALSKMNERILPRDLGRVVSEHFREARATTKRSVEEELAKWERGESTHVHLSVPVPDAPKPSASPGTKGSRPPPKPATFRPLLRAALLVLTLAGVVVLALWVRHLRLSGGVAPPSPAPLPSFTAPAEASSVPTSSTPPSAPPVGSAR
jgi:eukaryotic-like serine/threonine-protein kinase